MRPARLLFAAALTAAACASAPALASAAPPVNDNYLASLPVGPGRVHGDDRHDRGDDPARPLQPEPRRAAARRRRGRAADLQGHGLRQDGLVRPRAAGRRRRCSCARRGFQTVVAVYEWNPQDSQITRLVDCSANAAVDDLLLDVKGKKNYTIQVGGVAGAGGRAQLQRRRSSPTPTATAILDDQLDKCKTVPGIERFGGCPPELKVVPSIGFDGSASGITIKRLIVDRVPKGAKVVAKCSGLRLADGQGQALRPRLALQARGQERARAGTKIEIRVTLRQDRHRHLRLRRDRQLLRVAGRARAASARA